MALLKLWNSLLGRDSKQPAQPEPSAQADPDVDTETVALSVAKKKPARKSRGLFGGSSPNAALLKLLRGVKATSVLEIAVGDGSRAVEVLEFLNKSTEKNADSEAAAIRYAVIDQFEMGGSEHTLMQFHQTIRSAGVRPQIFPEPLERGLMRVAHTIGSIDLILISSQAGDWSSPETKALLARIAHDDSVILFQQDVDRNESWEKLSLSELGSEPVYRRAA